jgi:hypothetical protein
MMMVGSRHRTRTAEGRFVVGCIGPTEGLLCLRRPPQCSDLKSHRDINYFIMCPCTQAAPWNGSERRLTKRTDSTWHGGRNDNT